MASSARHLFLLAFVALLAVATPRVGAWGSGRLFFSKTTRPAVDEPEKAAAGTTAVPADASDPNSAAAFSRPSTGGSGRGYGLYGRPEESFPPGYFRRGVHRNAEKLTTTGTVPVGGRAEERAEPLLAEDNGSGRGRAPWTNANNNAAPATTTGSTDTEETVPATTARGADPSAEEDNGSGWGRPRRYYGPVAADGTTAEEQQRGGYGMSDTRLYQNGRYYYDVDAGRYGYGRESNPVRTRPEEFAGAGRGRYRGSAAAGYRQDSGNAAAGYRQDGGNGNELGNDGFQEEARSGRYIP